MSEQLDIRYKHDLLTQMGVDSQGLEQVTVSQLVLLEEDWSILIPQVVNRLNYGHIVAACRNGIWRSRVMPYRMHQAHGGLFLNFMPIDTRGDVNEGYRIEDLTYLLQQYAYKDSGTIMLPVMQSNSRCANPYVLPNFERHDLSQVKYYAPVNNFLLTLDLTDALELQLTADFLDAVAELQPEQSTAVQIIDWPEELYFKTARNQR
ncbi:hypothetical protein KC909_02520 [Candidatus Dojkabacteria bacterium]|uniref:Uncharacterized protein n=1 Tax=Candidatus Dojkabacteria bacterium TaxID=2099670 RepID=A0A955RIT0_9BACT|nr:hypothetical protein [Candidatus Dojkabacteria bacterium]